MEIVLIWCLFGFVAAVIANTKGRSGCGWFLLGVLLGPFALVIAFLPSTAQKEIKEAQNQGEAGDFKKCPYCAEIVRKEAIKCKHCGSDLPPSSSSDAKDIIVCSSCGRNNRSEDVTCIGCGTPLISTGGDEDYKSTLAYKAGRAWKKMSK